MEKSSRWDEFSAHTVTFPRIVSQNAPDCISAHVHFKKFPGGEACFQTPLGSLWPLATGDLSPPNDNS